MTGQSEDLTNLEDPFPALPLEEWKASKETLHKIIRLLGKIRVTLAPPRNHWWNATLYLSPVGITTGPVPYRGMTFDLEADLVHHRLRIRTSEGGERDFPIPGLSVREVHAEVFSSLRHLGFDTDVFDGSADLPAIAPSEEERSRSAYDREQVSRFFRLLARLDILFKEFSGRFLGKTSPVHFFGHSFDLAVTRFSGRIAPGHDPSQSVNEQGYSHELISFGFWPGDEAVPEPTFYSYTHPEPEGLASEPLSPGSATWVSQDGGGAQARLSYEDLRATGDPAANLLDFLESAYRAGARRGGWHLRALSALPENGS